MCINEGLFYRTGRFLGNGRNFRDGEAICGARNSIERITFILDPSQHGPVSQ